MTWAVTPRKTATPSFVCPSVFLNSVKNGALDIGSHFDTLQPQCDSCRGRNYFERVLFPFDSRLFLALGFPMFVSSCGFGFMRTKGHKPFCFGLPAKTLNDARLPAPEPPFRARDRDNF
jgi:hypothetical protein